MSLTFKVTIPVESLEALQSAYSKYKQPIIGSCCSCEDTKAVRDICDCVIDALATMPYELVTKECNKEYGNKEYGPPKPYRALSKTHSLLWTEEPAPPEDHGEEAEDENDEYDKVSVDGWEMYSARTSNETKDDSEERDTKDAITKDGYDDEYEEYDGEEEEEEEEEEEGEEDNDRTSCEGWGKPKESDASEMYHFPKSYEVIIEMEGTGMSLRITVGPYDTWNNLTEKLQRVISLPPNGVIFFYWGTTYEQGDNRMLEKAGVGKLSVIRALRKDSRSLVSSDGELPTYSRASAPGPRDNSDCVLTPIYPMFSSPSALPPGVPAALADETITIVFRDLMKQNLRIRTTSVATLLDLTSQYEALTGRYGSSLTFKMPNGAMYTLQSPEMKLPLRDLELHHGDVVLVSPTTAVVSAWKPSLGAKMAGACQEDW